MNKWLERYLDNYGNVTGNVTGKDTMVNPDNERIQTVEKMGECRSYIKDEFYLVEYFDSFGRPTQEVLLYTGDNEFFGAWWAEHDEDDADAACDISVAVCDALSIWEIKRGETPDG